MNWQHQLSTILRHHCFWTCAKQQLGVISASKSSIQRFVITEKAPTRAFSWLKADTTAFTFKTLLRHYAKKAFSVITNLRMDLFGALEETQHKTKQIYHLLSPPEHTATRPPAPTYAARLSWLFLCLCPLIGWNCSFS